jgi:hypothetical protein
VLQIPVRGHESIKRQVCVAWVPGLEYLWTDELDGVKVNLEHFSIAWELLLFQ